MTDSILLHLLYYQFLRLLERNHFLWILEILHKTTFSKSLDHIIVHDITRKLQLHDDARDQELLPEISTYQVDCNFCDLTLVWIGVRHFNV